MYTAVAKAIYFLHAATTCPLFLVDAFEQCNTALIGVVRSDVFCN